MTRLRFTDAREGPAPGKKSPGAFRAFETLRERRYERKVWQLKDVESRLKLLDGKRSTFRAMEKCARESVVDEECNNWNAAMRSARDYALCRKELKSESRSAAFVLFSKTMFVAAIPLGLMLIALDRLTTGIGVITMAVTGSLFVLGSAMKTWATIAVGSKPFLDAVSAEIDEEGSSLALARKRIMRELHGWKRSPDN